MTSSTTTDMADPSIVPAMSGYTRFSAALF